MSALDIARAAHLAAAQRLDAALAAYELAVDSCDGVDWSVSDAASDVLAVATDDHRAALAALLGALHEASSPSAATLVRGSVERLFCGSGNGQHVEVVVVPGGAS